MRVLVAEYASAVGMGGTWELEGRAMLSLICGSLERCGHDVVYPTHGPSILAGESISVSGESDFMEKIRSTNADAALLIAPDDLLPGFLRMIEGRAANLGCTPDVAQLCADKLLCTERLLDNGVPVAQIVRGPERPECGCQRYVIKPRMGCGSERVRISSFARPGPDEIATRYIEGLHLSASFIVGLDGFLPLTINRQLIEFSGSQLSYSGSHVPYNTPRADEIWEVARKASDVLGLKGYAGIDFVLGDFPSVVDVNARPTTSLVGIVRVMKEEIGELLLQAKFGGMPKYVNIVGSYEFRKDDL